MTTTILVCTAAATAIALAAKWLAKEAGRSRQREWAKRLEAKAFPWASRRGCYAHAAGWYPGCEPWWQHRRLEWVDVTRDLGTGYTVAHRFYYPDDPGEAEVDRICEGMFSTGAKL